MDLSDVVTMEDAGHSKRCFKSMQDFRRTQRFCDIKLQFEENVLYAHRLVLSTFSPFFFEKLQDGISNNKESTINLEEYTTFDIMSIILDYMYSGTITFELQIEECTNLLQTLDKFRMAPTRREIEKHLVEHLDLNNCVGILNLLGEFSDETVKTKILQFIHKNLRVLKETSSFNEIEVEHLQAILLSAAKNKTGKLLYETAISWLKCDSSRKRFFRDVLPYVPLKRINSRFVWDRIVSEEYLKNDEFGSRWLVENLLCNDSPIRQRPKLLHVFSNSADGNYEIETAKMQLRKLKPIPLSHIVATKDKDDIYMVGIDEIENIDAFKYDTANDVTMKFNYPFKKREGGLCILHDKLYLIGGLLNENAQTTCSVYDIKCDMWRSLSDINRARVNVGVAVHRSCIFAYGGYQNTGGTIVERYDPREGKWKDIAKIEIEGRCSVAVIRNQTLCLAPQTSKLLQFDMRNSKQIQISIGTESANSIAAFDENLLMADNKGIWKYHKFEEAWNKITSIPLDQPVLIY